MSDGRPTNRKRVVRRLNTVPAKSHSNRTPNDAHSSTDGIQRQPARRRPDGLMCSICEGPAHGYNFNAITCESCKAFFRRNALKCNEKLTCRIDDGQCAITIATRKRCKACRLSKCFEKGMRADWILTEEERENKRQKIEENRRLRKTLYPDWSDDDEVVEVLKPDQPTMAMSHEERTPTFARSAAASLLTAADAVKIRQIQEAYVTSVRLTSLPSEIPSFPHRKRLNETSDVVNIPANIQATRLITYFKLIPEFVSLNEDDKLILIKYNTFTLSFIRAALNYDPVTDTYHEVDTDECVFEGRDLIQCLSLYQYEQSTRCVCNLLSAAVNDRFVLQVLLLILLFSKGSSVCTYLDEAEPIAQDTLAIYRVQSAFIELLWRYSQDKYGCARTRDICLKLTMTSIDAHLQAYNIRHGYVKVDRVADQLAPLMKSVMLIA